jgi:CubicO group peptidase (beta-lactamase class C family)
MADRADWADRANRTSVDAARALLERAVADRIFPAAVAEVGDSHGTLWREAFGSLTFSRSAAPATRDTIFDLASLTKPLATTSVIVELAAQGAVDLADPVAKYFAEWRGAAREEATVRDLLEHAAGLAARLLDVPPSTRREFEHEICTLHLEYAPRAQSIYSDLGFILLGFIAENRGGSSLSDQFDRIMVRVRASAAAGGTAGPGTEAVTTLAFGVPAGAREAVAPTSPEENDARRGRTLVGEVHDDYAAALGGVAGHAGLFGTAAGVALFARVALRAARDDVKMPSPLSPALIQLATTKSSVPGSSRALGWDTMLPTSSCGTELSPAAFGHVGYTGTSLWIDPILDRYFILLTNRVCSGGSLDEIRQLRRAFHNAVAKI